MPRTWPLGPLPDRHPEVSHPGWRLCTLQGKDHSFFLSCWDISTLQCPPGMTPMFPQSCPATFHMLVVQAVFQLPSLQRIPAGLETEDLGSSSRSSQSSWASAYLGVECSPEPAFLQRGCPLPLTFPFQHKNSIYFYA